MLSALVPDINVEFNCSFIGVFTGDRHEFYTGDRHECGPSVLVPDIN